MHVAFCRPRLLFFIGERRPFNREFIEISFSVKTFNLADFMGQGQRIIFHGAFYPHACLRQQHQIIPVDNGVAISITENVHDLR